MNKEARGAVGNYKDEIYWAKFFMISTFTSIEIVILFILIKFWLYQ